MQCCFLQPAGNISLCRCFQGGGFSSQGCHRSSFHSLRSMCVCAWRHPGAVSHYQSLTVMLCGVFSALSVSAAVSHGPLCLVVRSVVSSSVTCLGKQPCQPWSAGTLLCMFPCAASCCARKAFTCEIGSVFQDFPCSFPRCFPARVCQEFPVSLFSMLAASEWRCPLLQV